MHKRRPARTPDKKGIPSRSEEGYKSEGGLFRKLEPVRIFILPRLGAGAGAAAATGAGAAAAAFLLDGNVHDEAAGGGTERIGDFEPGDLGAIPFKIVFTADSDTVFPRQEVVFDLIFCIIKLRDPQVGPLDGFGFLDPGGHAAPECRRRGGAVFVEIGGQRGSD